MNTSDFETKKKILGDISILFKNSFSVTRMSKLVDIIFNEGEHLGYFIDKNTYRIILRICGDINGFRQGTPDLIVTKIYFTWWKEDGLIIKTEVEE